MSRMIMNTLNRGDMVQITDYEGDSDKIYTIKEIKKSEKVETLSAKITR